MFSSVSTALTIGVVALLFANLNFKLPILGKVALVIWVFGLIAGGLSLLFSPSDSFIRILYCGGAFLSLLLFWSPSQKAIARWVPIEVDNPVHIISVGMALVLFSALLDSLIIGGHEKLHPPTIWDALSNLAIFLFLSAIGLGLFYRRNIPQFLERLGFTKISWPLVFFGLSMGVLFLVLSSISDMATAYFSPSSAIRLNQINQQLYGQTNILVLLLLAVTSGAGEEIIFRGALQPRLGILPVAILFTLSHVQYIATEGLLLVFLLALLLGWMRKTVGLWACLICHILYDSATAFPISSGMVWILGSIGICVLAVLWWHRHSWLPSLNSVPRTSTPL